MPSSFAASRVPDEQRRCGRHAQLDHQRELLRVHAVRRHARVRAEGDAARRA